MRLLFSIVAVLLAGCSSVGDEAARVTSPNGGYDAVVLEDGAGATTSFWYNVCVVPTTKRCTDRDIYVVLYDAGRNPSAYGVNLRWSDTEHLIVEYDTAKSVKRLQSDRAPLGAISIELAPGTVDRLAPPGAMIRGN